MRLNVAACAALILQTVSSSPVRGLTSRSEYSVKETHFVPRGWSEIGHAHPEHTIDLKIGLKNKNFAELERQLYDISDPSHARYRQHLSKEQLNTLVQPDAQALSLVEAWLQENNVDKSRCRYSAAKDWISVSLPVEHVEEMLDTKYSVYKHNSGDSLVRTTSWSLPNYLHEHISTIQPTTAFLRASPKLKTVLDAPASDASLSALLAQPNVNQTDLLSVCNFEGMTPACLRRLYGTEKYVPKSKDSHVGFANYLGEVPLRSDATIFLSNLRPEAVSTAQSFEQIAIAGGPVDNGTAEAGVEANLDLQTIAGLVYPINITSYSTGGEPPFIPDLHTTTNTNEPYLTWLDYILSSEDIPQTISTSYGDDEQTVPQSYAQVVCEGLAHLGMIGTTVLFSSGDYGVGDNGTCVSNDGKNTTMFVPAFPASCPYITAVGGTRGFPEVVAYDDANGYVSGSGFSNYFPQPAYQKSSGVVDSYLATVKDVSSSLYNASGRAYPDIAAQGYKYLIFSGGKARTVDGTSCSAPAMAGIFANVNDALIAAGQKPLGFLNPWLYSGAGDKAFTDVTSGSVTGCDGPGFAAGPGWDAASGFGSPQFETILEVLGVTPKN